MNNWITSLTYGLIMARHMFKLCQKCMVLHFFNTKGSPKLYCPLWKVSSNPKFQCHYRKVSPSETGGPSDQRGKKGGRFDYLCYG